MKSNSAQQQNLDQEVFDRKMKGRDTKQIAKNIVALMSSKDKDSLQEKNDYPRSVGSLDAIERTMLRFLGLTREKAEALAEFHGF